MKIVKLTMLVAIAAFASMAFIGASSASATHQVIQLCKAQELLLCAAGNLIKHPLKGRVLLLLGKFSLKALFSITCPSGHGESDELEFFSNGAPVNLTLTSLTFSACEGGCKVIEVAPKQSGKVFDNKEVEPEWFLEAPTFKIKFSSCEGGATCTFEGVLKVKVQMDAEGSFLDFGKDKPAFNFVEGSKIFCGSVLTWNEGLTRLDWRLDDASGTIHKTVYLTLLEKLAKLEEKTHPVTQLCKAQELLLCAEANLIQHPLKGRILALAGKGTFKALFTITCANGMGDSSEFEGFGENEVKLELAELTFTGCEGGCRVFEVTKNQAGTLSMSTEGEAGEWFLSFPTFKMKFSSCTGGATCTYEGNTQLKVQMDAEGSFFNAATDKPAFKLVEGSKIFCGESGTWNEGSTRLDWRLDDGVKEADGTLGTIHKTVYLTLLEKLAKLEEKTHPVTQLCKAQELLLCAEANLIQHPLKGRILALAGKGTFKALFTITCANGMGDSSEFEGFGENEVKLELAELTFTGCEGGCRVFEVTKNQAGTLSMSTEGEAGEWFLSFPTFKMKFSSCTGGATCTYEGNTQLKVQMDAEGSFFNAATDKPAFKLVEGSKIFCGESGTWNEGSTRLDWRLDDGVKEADGTLGTIHKTVYLTLLEKLAVSS